MNDAMETQGRPVSVRVRLTTSQAEQFDKLREFLGLPSLSGTVARLALWNLSTLSEALSVETSPEKIVGTMGPMIVDVAKAAVRSAFREGLVRMGGAS